MRHSLAKFVLILVLVKIDQLDSRAVEVVYTGEGCECTKTLPYQVNIPVQPAPADLECNSYGYKVEAPVQTKAKYSYSFDFVVEEPIPITQRPACKQNLFAKIDRIALPKPDCVVETVAAPCGVPAPAPPPPPAVKACQYDKTKVCTCGMCKVPIDYDYDVPVVAKSCGCGRCHPSKPQCRYVLSGIQTNQIERPGVRSKRDISSKKQQYISEIRDYVKTLKAARKAKKSRLVKRDIKGEYDLLQKDQAALDLTIPEIIQYMPETLMPNFKRGKCNIGCKNCINKDFKEEEENNFAPENDNNQESQQSKEPTENSNESEHTPSNQQFRMSPRFNGVNYLKRSVNPYQYPYPCYPAIMPPPYIPSPMHLTTFAQNPGNPIWYQPRPLIDPNGYYVYDRLGHKYEVRNGSLKLVTPQSVDGVNVSAPAAPEESSQATTATQQSQSEANAAIIGDQQVLQAPVVGAPAQHDPSYDPQMDKVIRDIIYKHPDFVDATQHAPGALTQPQNVQRDETMQFLGKLIRGRLNNWFGANEEVPPQNLQDLNRYSRETGTSIKFIPVVTVDKDKLNKYRQEKAQDQDAK